MQVSRLTDQQGEHLFVLVVTKFNGTVCHCAYYYSGTSILDTLGTKKSVLIDVLNNSVLCLD